MGQIFFRTYLGTVFAVILANVTSMVIINYGYQAHAVLETKQLARGTVKLVLSRLEGKSLKEQQTILQKIRPDFDYPLQLIPWYNVLFTEVESDELLKGHLVVRYDSFLKKIGLYALAPSDNHLLFLGPIEIRSDPVYSQLWISVLVALVVVAFIVFFLARPIESRLARLEKTATRLAHGDLSVRLLATEQDPIGRLEGAFNYMADRIESLVRSQQELTNAVSHELRTPIARIRFELEMLNMATTQAEQERRVKEVDRDLSDLDGLIDELLTYARLGAAAPPIKFEELIIEELLENVCKNVMTIYEHIEYHWKREKSAPATVNAEARYLHRALHNLVSNASHYAQKQVRILFIVLNGNNLVYVDDDGPGIPKDDRERIFSPFTRLDNSRNRETGGYGLGLAIVRRIVRWHQGKIWIEDSPLGGARFVLSWPRKANT